MAKGSRGAIRVAAVTAVCSMAIATNALAGDLSLGTVDGVEYLKDSSTVMAPAGGSVAVLCPGATKASGGGFGQSALSGEANDSFPIGSSGWGANVQFPGGGTHTLDGFAICSEGKRSYEQSERQLEAGKTQKLTALCTNGEHLIGGGATILGSIADARLNSSYPLDSKDPGKAPDDGWRARGVNLSGTDLEFQAFAICAHRQPAYRSEKATLSPGTSSGLSSICPDSKQVLSGGVRLSGPGPEGVTHALRPSDGGDANVVPDDGFLANGHNLTGASGPKTLTGYAVCG